MSEAYTKLGIEIEVGKVVTVHTDKVKQAATDLNTEFNKAFKDTNVFQNLAKGISELTAKLSSVSFGNVTKGITEVKTALTNLNTSTEVKVSVSTDEARKQLNSFLIETKKLKDTNISGGLQLKVSAPVVDIASVKASLSNTLAQLQTMYKEGTKSFFTNPGGMAASYNSQKMTEIAVNPNTDLKTLQSFAKIVSAALDDNYKTTKKSKAALVEYLTVADSSGFARLAQAFKTTMKLPKIDQGSDKSIETLIKNLKKVEDNDSLGKFNQDLIRVLSSLQRLAGVDTSKIKLPSLSTANPNFVPEGRALSSLYSTRKDLSVPPSSLTTPFIEKYFSGATQTAGLTQAAEAISQTSKQAQAEIAKNKAEVDNLVVRIKDLEKSNKTLQAELTKASEGRLVYSAKAMEIAATSLNVDRSKLKEALELYSAQQQAQKAVYEKTKGDAGVFANPNQKLLDQQRKEQEQQGTQLLAALKNTRTATKEEQDKIVTNWQQYLAALKNSGQQYYNGSVVPKTYVTDTGNAWTAAHAEQSRRATAQVQEDQRKVIYSGYANRDADGAYQVYLANTTKLQSEERRQQEEHGKQLLATIKNTNSMEKAERDKAAEDWKQYLAALKNSGQQYYNGSVVPKSYITDVGNARSAAIAEESKRNKITPTSQVVDPVKAESLARIQQAFNVLDQLKRTASSTKVTADEVAEAFRKAGVNISQLENRSANNLVAGLRGIKIEADAVNNTFKNGGKEVSVWSKVFGESIGKVAARLAEFYSLRSIIFGVTGQLQSMVSEVFTLNQTLHDTIAITGGVSSGFEQLEDTALAIATTSKFSATQVAEGMKVLAQAGVATKDLPEMTNVTAMLATGSGSTMDQASKILTTGMNVWKLESKDAILLANTFTAALNASKLEVGELGIAFNYLASQSALSGRSINETTALIAVLRNKGQQASTIGTSMSSLLGAFLNPTKKVDSFLKAYGLTREDVDPTVKSLKEIIKAFEDAAGKKGVAVKDIFESFDKRVARGAATLFQASSLELEAMEAQIKNTNAAAVAWQESMKGAHAQFNVVKAEFTRSLNDIANQADGIGPALLGFAKNFAIGLRDSISQVAILTGALTTLGLAAWANPVAAAIGAVGLAVAGVVAGIGKITRGTAEQFEQLNNKIADTSRSYQDSISQLREMSTLVTDPNKWDNGQLKASEAQKKALIELMNKYGIAEDKLKDQKKLQEEIRGVLQKQTAELKLQNREYVNQYNHIVDKANLEITEARKSYRNVTGKDADPKKPLSEQNIAFSDVLRKANTSGTIWSAGDALYQYSRFNLKKKQAKASTEAATTTRNMVAHVAEAQTEEQGAGLLPKIKWSEDRAASINKAVSVNGEKNTPDSLKAGGSKKDKAAAYGDKSIIEQLKDESTKLKNIVQEQTEIIKDTEKTFGERNAAFEKAQASLTSHNAADLFAEVLTETKKFVDANGVKGYDPAAHLSALQEGKGGEYKLNTNNDASLALLRSNIQKINEKSQAIYSKEMAKLNKENLDTNKKFLDEFNKQAEKIDEEAYKRRAEGAKRAIEFAFKQTGSGAEVSGLLSEYLNATNARVDKDYDEKESKLAEWYTSLSESEQTQSNSKYANGLTELAEERQLSKDAKLSEIMNSGISGVEGRVVKDDKRADVDLGLAQQRVTLGKELATTADEVNKLEAEGIGLSIKATEAKTAHAKAALASLDALTLEFAKRQGITVEVLKQRGASNLLGSDAQSVYNTLSNLATDYGDRIKSNTIQLQQQQVALNKQQDNTFFGNFTQGVEVAWKSLSDFKTQTKQLGSSFTDTATNGLASSLSTSFNAAFNPDTSKVNELKASIATLTTQKTTLETDIRTIEANSSKSPQELKDLADKKLALQGVNDQLNAQNAAVRAQTSAWQSFADGLKGVMKSILQELQNYIAKLLAVKMMEMMVSGISSLFGAAEAGTGMSMVPTSTGPYGGVSLFAKGGIVKGYADGGLVNGISGGLIPSTMGVPGKDSVPIMGMPNEYIIPADVVKSWGAGHFENYRNGTFKKMAEGGLVSGKAPSAPSSNANQKQEFTLQIVNIADASQIPSQPVDAQQVLNIISYSAAQRGPVYKTIKSVVNS